MGLLAAAAAIDNNAQLPFPLKKVNKLEGWIPRGQMKLPFSRAVLTLSVSLKERLAEQAKQHEALHDDPGHTEQNCRQFARTLNYWANQGEQLTHLFWEMVRHEVPGLTACSNIGFDESWQILTPANTEPDPFVTRPEHQVRMTMFEFTQIMRSGADETPVPSKGNLFSELKAGDTDIAIVTDSRIQKLWCLANKLKSQSARCKARALRSFADALDALADDPAKGEDLLKQLEGMKITTEAEGQILERQEELVRNLAWCLIRDTYLDPLDERSDSIALRNDWKLVACAGDDGDSEPNGLLVLEGILSSPRGTGLGGLFSRRSGLLEKLRRAAGMGTDKEK